MGYCFCFFDGSGAALSTIKIDMQSLAKAVTMFLANIRKETATLGEFFRSLPLGHKEHTVGIKFIQLAQHRLDLGKIFRSVDHKF